MNRFILVALIFCSCIAFGQRNKSIPLAEIEEQLMAAFNKIDYWYQHEDRFDSLERANAYFERLLLKYTSSYPATLTHPFKKLDSAGVSITTSEDGLFRIYSWNTLTGGSMRFYRVVFQYKGQNAIFSSPSKFDGHEPPDPGCFYYQINDVVSGKKTFYMAQAISILSSALFYYAIDIFSIERNNLNDKAKLIKTKSGIQNSLGYEIDLSATANRTADIQNNYEIEYNKATKTISIPLVQEDYKITDKRIRYRFTGKYFEKL